MPGKGERTLAKKIGGDVRQTLSAAGIRAISRASAAAAGSADSGAAAGGTTVPGAPRENARRASVSPGQGGTVPGSSKHAERAGKTALAAQYFIWMPPWLTNMSLCSLLP